MKEIDEFTKEDFLESTEPYEYMYQFKDDPFTYGRKLEMLSESAKAQGVRNFKTLLKGYMMVQTKNNVVFSNNATNFDGQELELSCGRWYADDNGIYMIGSQGEELEACNHPLLPVLRLVNIDTGIEKLRLAYRKGKQWRSVIADKKTLASINSILELANVGIAVNSQNARYMVKYLHDIESLNYELIPEKNSVARLGWIDGHGFSPYVDDLVFDGDANFKNFFESVKKAGKFERWLECARKARQECLSTRIVLAGAFASVLVRPLNGLPFFIHLWGGTEVGKTVGLMLAASVWATPEIGRYIHTFNSTAVGREKSAAFVNSLPLILDELQIVKDKKEFDKDIYLLSEGAGRTRGNRGGGVDKTPTWANCVLTSGETPVTGALSGAGAVNRIIEIECKEKLFENPRETADFIKRNYGHAGKIFVEKLQDEGGIDEAQDVFKGFYDSLCLNDTTDKQALSAALILTADALATNWIFQDSRALTVEDITTFLQSKSSVSINERAYDYLCEYIAQNRNKFTGNSEVGDVWGELDGNQVYVVRREFNRICDDAGFNSQAILSWLRSSGKIEVPTKGFTKLKRINGIPTHCVVLTLQQEANDIFDLIEDLE